MRANQITFISIAALAVLLSSCSAAPSANQSVSPKASPLTAEQARDAFEVIATASCDKAMAEGVVEQSLDPNGFTLVMVPKDQAYQDFSAAYFEPADTYELIWEVDALSACGAAIQFALAQESSAEVDLAVSFDQNDGSFLTVQDLGEFGISKLKYKVADSLLSSVETQGSANSATRSISYGNLQDADWQILRTAVDRYLAGK